MEPCKIIYGKLQISSKKIIAEVDKLKLKSLLIYYLFKITTGGGGGGGWGGCQKVDLKKFKGTK